MPFCEKCGGSIEPGSKFCDNCGVQLDNQALSTPPQPTNSQEPALQPTSQRPPAPAAPPSSAPIPPIYIAVGIVVVVIIIALVFASGAMPGSSNHVTSSSGLSQEVLAGDIDNLGFGWPKGFDVFLGQKTPAHTWPFSPEIDDVPGTDRMLVGSGLNPGLKGYGQDGYTRDSKWPDNTPVPITLSYTPSGKRVASAQLQIFTDDFQPVIMQSRFEATLNGKRANFIENVVNKLNQTGPIGQLVTFDVPGEFFPDIESGNLNVLIDDPNTGMGDGFAIDFIRLLVVYK